MLRRRPFGLVAGAAKQKQTVRTAPRPDNCTPRRHTGHLAVPRCEQTPPIYGCPMYDDDDDVYPFEAAEAAEAVRGQHFTAWWGEVERLKQNQQWVEYEALLCEMRDAAERGAQIAGYTVVPGPAMALAQLYSGRGDSSRAVAELERFLTVIARCRLHEPTGGDTGQTRAMEQLKLWTGRDSVSRDHPVADPTTSLRSGGSRPRRRFLPRRRR